MRSGPILMNDPFAPIALGSKKSSTARPATRAVIMPVPADAPAPPSAHPTLGARSATWRYADAAGGLLGFAYRFESASGKQYRPLTFWHAADGRGEWRWEAWPAPRPLYGLQGLAARPSAAVVVCEGEKAADAAAKLLPDCAVVTSPNGSKSAGKADWSPLKGRTVTVWPDADAAGLEYARQVAKLVTAAGAVSVAIVSPPADVKVGWDAADVLAEGWTKERAIAFINGAIPAEQIASDKSTAAECDETSEHDAAPGGRRRTPQRDVLIGLTEFVELWHDAGRTAYASFSVNDHCEHWSVRSRDFRMWLSGRFYEATGSAIGGQALEDGLRILEARAVNEGAFYACFNRTGAADGKMFLDLGDANWHAVEITSDGWSVVGKAPIKLLRSPAMRTLPAPEGWLFDRGTAPIRATSNRTMIFCWWWPGLWPRCARKDRSLFWLSAVRPAAASRCSRACCGRSLIRAQRRSARCRGMIATWLFRQATHGSWRSTICRACRHGSPTRSAGWRRGAVSRRACCTPIATK